MSTLKPLSYNKHIYPTWAQVIDQSQFCCSDSYICNLQNNRDSKTRWKVIRGELSLLLLYIFGTHSESLADEQVKSHISESK